MTSPRIRSIDRFRVRVPLDERTSHWSRLLVNQWTDMEFFRVETDDPDVVGWGEAILDYSWSRVPEGALADVMGTPVATMVFEDRLGLGLQMAILDAAGKAAEVPSHRLLPGGQVRDAVPISWWVSELPPEVMAAEAEIAVAKGYRSMKIKARPWFDIIDQVAAVSAVTPPDFALDLDWNSTLLTPAHALAVLRDLEDFPRVKVFESPVRRSDLAGQRFIRSRIDRPLAEHYSEQSFASTIIEDAVDGFVVTGGLSDVLSAGALAAGFHKSLWLQNVGAGLTTAFAAHAAAVLSHARWPMVTAMNAFSHSLLVDELTIEDGRLLVPRGDGLGVDVDVPLLESLELSEGPPVMPRMLLTLTVPGLNPRTYPDSAALWRDFEIDAALGVRPVGARLEVEPDDGSASFDARHRQAGMSSLSPHQIRGY